MGSIFYGGARFKGRIECCSGLFCNNKSKLFGYTRKRFSLSSSSNIFDLIDLDTKLKARKRRIIIPILIITTLSILLILVTIGISYAVYRCCLKKDEDRYGPVAVNETEFALNSIEKKLGKKQTQNTSPNDYPEECATP